MYDKYICGKPHSMWRTAVVYYWAILLLIGCGLWLGPSTLKRPLIAGGLVVLGVGGLVGGDRWGLTESQSRGKQFLGWGIVAVFAGVLLFAAYQWLFGK
jgi:hypothetical protein